MLNIVGVCIFALIGTELWLKMWGFDTKGIDNVWKEIIHTIFRSIVKLINFVRLLMHEYVQCVMKGGHAERKLRKRRGLE